MTVRGLSPGTNSLAPVTVAVASTSAGSATTSTEVVPTARETLLPSETLWPFTVKVLSEVPVPEAYDPGI